MPGLFPGVAGLARSGSAPQPAAGGTKRAPRAYTGPMSEGNRSNAVLYVALGGLALVGLCCVGVGGMMFWGYRQANAEMEQFAEEARRQQQLAEEEARRQQQLAEEEYARALEEQQRAGQPLFLQDVPPPLSIAPTATRDRRTRRIAARVTRVDGWHGIAVGDRCDFDVTVEESTSQPAGYWCRAFVECSGTRLYGTDTPRRNGFFPCEIFRGPLGVAGEDRETTQGTGDGFFQIDTRARRMVVMDDSTSMVGSPFRIEAAITRVH